MPLEPNLESVLTKVNQFINIDAHRQRYTDHFSNLKNIIFNNIRNNDNVFNYMLNGFQLCGSYGDNAKVSIPNEFDIVFHITFPEQSLIKVIKDEESPGNIFLDFTTVIQKIAKEKQHENNLKYLKMWLDYKNFLRIDKFQNFIQTCFLNVLSALNRQIVFKGKTSSLRYKRTGPAHTIYVFESLDFEYSVDFVPGILLNDKQSLVPNLKGQWEAIPKIDQTNYQNKLTSFRASYYQQEHSIIKSKYQLKNVYRMLKKFRDTKTNMSKMKSYYIKTLLLHKDSRENFNYWTKPLTVIIIDIFRDLEKSLQDKNLPFFWDKNLNLYERYSPTLTNEMLRCVENSRKILENATNQLTAPLQNSVYRIFLNTNERDMLKKQNDKSTLGNIYVKEITSLNCKSHTSEIPISDGTTGASTILQKTDVENRCVLC